MLSEKFKSLVKTAVEGYHDPWENRHIEKLPAEIVTRHRYIPSKRIWVTDTSLIKMEAEPFDRGAQRQIYRLKKISQAPTVNWRKIDWARAPNYVAKTYITADGSIGTEDKIRCFNDVRLQYEAAHWANIFNKAGPPKAIHVIQCYVLELTSRPGAPVVGCERFVDGHDKYGAGFVKHNSNSGYVDGEEKRATPQAFSAHSFYASAGKLMVVDVQGVGDLYTDPQIHTQDDRFGNSDLGIRGMALFFVSFRRNPVCDFLKLPRFPISTKERNRMQNNNSSNKVAKAPIDPSDGTTGIRKDFQLHRQDSDQKYVGKAMDTVSRAEALEFEKKLLMNSSFSALSPSEQREYLPAVLTSEDQKEIEVALNRAISSAFRVIRTVHKKDSPILNDAELAEIAKDPIESLKLFDFSNGVQIDEEIIFTTMDPNMIHLHFHPDDIMPVESPDSRQSHVDESLKNETESTSSNTSNTSNTSNVTTIHDTKTNHEKLLLLQKNTGEVHLELATLEAAGRFSLDVTIQNGTQSKQGLASHAIQSPLGDAVADISSCIFHLAEASVLGSCAAALALGRLRFGLSTDVLMTLTDYVPRDRGSALALLMLAAFRGSANGACLAAQICDTAGEIERAISLFQLSLYHMRNVKLSSPQNNDNANGDSVTAVASSVPDILKTNPTSQDGSKHLKFSSGAEIEVNYLGCDSWYPAIYVEAVDENTSKVRYVDGDQEEIVTNNWIRGSQKSESVDAISHIDNDDLQATDSNSPHPNSPHPHSPPVHSSMNHEISSSPQSDNISSYLLQEQQSNPSTVTTIGQIGSDQDIEYQHKVGIGGDDLPSLTSYEILHAIAQLHGKLAKKYEDNDSLFSQLRELTVKYFNETSTEAFDCGKVAFAMKCLEEAAEFE